MIDEAHTAKADALKGILEKASTADFRFGFTGTLDGIEYNRLIIEGLCGPVYRAVKTKELMDAGRVSELLIRCMVLKYGDKIRKQVNGLKFNQDFFAGYSPEPALLNRQKFSL